MRSAPTTPRSPAPPTPPASPSSSGPAGHSTQASAATLLGGPVRDTAILTGGDSPTGTITFRLVSDSGCATEVFTSTNTLASPTHSDWFTPTAAGTYYWTAAHSGDANNNVALSGCNAPNESVVVSPFAAPPITRTIAGNHLGP